MCFGFELWVWNYCFIQLKELFNAISQIHNFYTFERRWTQKLYNMKKRQGNFSMHEIFWNFFAKWNGKNIQQIMHFYCILLHFEIRPWPWFGYLLVFIWFFMVCIVEVLNLIIRYSNIKKPSTIKYLITLLMTSTATPSKMLWKISKGCYDIVLKYSEQLNSDFCFNPLMDLSSSFCSVSLIIVLLANAVHF